MANTVTEPGLITVGVLARELGVAQHKITYILQKCRHIRPSARAGVVRLYSRESLAQVAAELQAMAKQKPAQPVAGKKLLVELTVLGGVVEAAAVPPGVRVEVRDYDLPDVSREKVEKDEDGEEFVKLVFEG